MNLKLSYKYGSSSEFDLNVQQTESGSFEFANINGFRGYEYMPNEGDTVTVYSNVIGTANTRDFIPDFNNKFYWLVSNDIITDRDTVISQGTAISVSLSGGRYTGTFVYNNPDDFKYLYIVADYKNYINLASSVTYSFDVGEVQVIDGKLEQTPGVIRFVYIPTTGGITAKVEYNGSVVVELDNVSTPGYVTFTKTSTTEDDVRMIIENNSASANSVTLGYVTEVLEKFSIDPLDGTLSDVCSQTPSLDVFHNGEALLPVAGNIVYTDVTGSSVYDGGNAYHKMNTTSGGGTTYIELSTDGVVRSVGSCVCSEIAAPVITQADITVVKGQAFSIAVEASNNPTSWSIVSSCNEYELSGGVKGSVFSYTDCDGNSKRATAGINSSTIVCASALPTVVTGTGTVTLIGVCQDKSLPKGISFSNGIISGVGAWTGSFDITLNATNCFGTSANETITVTVESAINMKPFAIDVQQPSDTGANACLLSSSYDLLYHNGIGDIPTLNDIVYNDARAVDPFVGGKLWYKIDNSLYSVQIDEYGTVINEHVC